MSRRRRYRTSAALRRRRHRFAPSVIEAPETPPPVVGNVWTFPREIENEVWIRVGVSIGPDFAEAPDESSFTMDLVREDSNDQQHRIERDMAQAAANQPQLLIGYVKPVGRDFLWVRTTGRHGGVVHSIFELTGAGSVVREDAGHISSIWLMPNGVYAFRIRVQESAIGDGIATPIARFNIAQNSTSLTYQGSGAVAGLGLWDLRFHPNTSGSNVPFPEYEVQEPGGGPEPTTHILRVGWMRADNILGLGPGDAAGSAANPIYRVGMFTPNFSDINQKLEIAEENDILLVLNFARARNNWLTQTASGPVYTHSLYEDEVEAWANHAGVRLAVQQRRVVAYCHDEPNHPSFNGTLSPFLMNEGNLFHKSIWPGIITTNRVNGRTLTDGWDGFDPVDYTGCDYGWLQIGPQHHPANTPAGTYAEHKALLAALDMGMIPGLNWPNGGHTTSVNNAGVDHCWDYNNDGVSRGVLIGTRDAEFADGTKVPCGDSRIDGATIVVANPGWVRACIDAAVTDQDAPFFMYWQHPGDSTVNHPAHVAAYNHPQMVQSLRYAINQGLARANWTGWRTPK